MLPRSHDDLAAVLRVPSSQMQAMRRKARAAYRRKTDSAGKKRRVLRVPLPWLRDAQRTLLRALRPQISVSDAAMARPKHGAVAHARSHLGFGWCHTSDVKDCFPSISRDVVRRALREAGLGEDAAEAVLDLTTIDDQLPQGAPSSTWLVDVVFTGIDEHLLVAARRVGASYSRYVDDIAISAPNPETSLVAELHGRLKRAGLRVNASKSRSAERPRGIVITGVQVTNGSMRPTTKFMSTLAAEIRAHNAGRETTSKEELRGRLAWVRQLDPRFAARISTRIR
jgi:RNA-directed DNA polymerase